MMVWRDGFSWLSLQRSFVLKAILHMPIAFSAFYILLVSQNELIFAVNKQQCVRIDQFCIRGKLCLGVWFCLDHSQVVVITFLLNRASTIWVAADAHRCVWTVVIDVSWRILMCMFSAVVRRSSFYMVVKLASEKLTRAFSRAHEWLVTWWSIIQVYHHCTLWVQ